MKKSPEPGYLFSKSYTNYVFILLFLLYMFDYVDRVVVTSMFTSIEHDYGISHTQSGLLVSAVYWAIVILTFPASILVDRWKRNKTIGLMAIMWSIATALCALTGNFLQLVITRALIGVGEAGYAPGGTAMISGMYPQEKRSKMMGLWNASIPLGTAIGVLLGGIIAAHWGWKHAFGLVAIPGFIVAILFLFVKFRYPCCFIDIHCKPLPDHFFIGVITATRGFSPVQKSFYQFFLSHFQCQHCCYIRPL